MKLRELTLEERVKNLEYIIVSSLFLYLSYSSIVDDRVTDFYGILSALILFFISYMLLSYCLTRMALSVGSDMENYFSPRARSFFEKNKREVAFFIFGVLLFIGLVFVKLYLKLSLEEIFGGFIISLIFYALIKRKILIEKIQNLF